MDESMKISTDKADIVREARRLSHGSRSQKRHLLKIGYQAEFEDRLPVLINGRLGTLPMQLLGEVRI